MLQFKLEFIIAVSTERKGNGFAKWGSFLSMQQWHRDDDHASDDDDAG